MSPYAEVDPIIEKWVERLGSKLLLEWADRPARWFHIPGDPPFECFQISIDPPSSGRISVHARAVDTNDDIEDELELSWTGQVAELDAMMAAAVDRIAIWKPRQRKKPDPPSPW
jgi:hypothetical protein